MPFLKSDTIFTRIIPCNFLPFRPQLGGLFTKGVYHFLKSLKLPLPPEAEGRPITSLENRQRFSNFFQFFRDAIRVLFSLYRQEFVSPYSQPTLVLSAFANAAAS